MRELRVIGLTPDSTHIVCIDTETGQKYRLAADDKLRAAARGDLARFGQIEIEMEATMRPRDIQARIRAGASVEQVTEESGMPLSRVERFAYPVLLERARAAELAQKAHPVRNDGPAVETLIDIVAAAFAERGHNIEVAEWDAWKDEKGYWVAQLQWQAGRSVIAAHWRYQPDAHGGSVVPLDDPASDLIDPDFGRALRGLATILPDQTERAIDHAPVPAPAPREERAAEYEAAPARATSQQSLDGYFEQRAAVGADTVPVPAAAAAPAPVAPNPPSAPDRSDRVGDRPVIERQPVERTERPAVERQTAERPAVERPVAERHERSTPERSTTERPNPPAAPAATAELPAAAATTAEPVAAEPAPAQPAAKPAAQKPNRAKRGGKAPMPSWEDVLLGVRSSGH
ncbi:septation protein SepH [Nocardia inohanensis]|uniref:septation protein SepH n=1 Tax=Nocardia inohanensis TaxID=209246 RepID=UPI00082B644C|nr:septation protein SepH [Nocardia inohanensis]